MYGMVRKLGVSWLLPSYSPALPCSKYRLPFINGSRDSCRTHSTNEPKQKLFHMHSTADCAWDRLAVGVGSQQTLRKTEQFSAFPQRCPTQSF